MTTLPEHPQATFVTDDAAEAGGHLVLWGEHVAELGFPPGEPFVLRTVLPRGAALAPADVPAVAVPLGVALPALVHVSPGAGVSDSLVAWGLAARRTLEDVDEGRTRPGDWLADLADAMPPAAHALRVDDERVWPARALLVAFWHAVVRGRVLAASSGDGDLDDLADARLHVLLAQPAAGADSWPLRLGLRRGNGALVTAEDVWTVGGHEHLVRALADAARVFPPLAEALAQQRPSHVPLTAAQATEFLTTGAAALSAGGVEVEIADELAVHDIRPRLAGVAGTTFRWQAAAGDRTLTSEEVERIAGQDTPLVRWHGSWIRVDPDTVAGIAAVLGTEVTLSGVAALAVALSGEHDTREFGVVEVVAHDRVAALADSVRRAGAGREPDVRGVTARLRDYQARGVAWLQSLAATGFGALLADDMGLGKTLQAICLLTSRTETGPHLVVCPTSVVGNWERELARFAPGTTVVRHHGPHREPALGSLAPGVVVVTSYGVLRQDRDVLTDALWDVVVLDEAQQIKNQAAQAARVASELKSAARVALTGTPVENRLSELWSIMNFVNPGLLGTFSRFRDRFAGPVERSRDEDAARRLRRITAPFLLRRLKSDVASELPEKQESIVACTLTQEQESLYRQAVLSALAGGLGSGMARRGRILKLLTALKQICNHPAQYLGETGSLAGRSGKLARATEMLSEVVESGGRALVFTQYRVMGDLLVDHLGKTLELAEIPFLHGGLPLSRREKMVARFQEAPDGPPVLVISLRAGGFGLNLTRATTVLHYDRWWNPAVEDQATDRAHRIGQRARVHVYKLVTGGTLEERIEELLVRKRRLADAVVSPGETWLTELDDGDLRALVELTGHGEDE
nr:putative helicase [uncultured bacterium]